MFKNKVVLITGATGGIGIALANAFYIEKCMLALHYNKNKEKADLMVDNFSAIAVQADISDATEVKIMIKQVIDHYGRIDILINNAGIHDDNLIWKIQKAQWDKVIAVNLTGPYLTMMNVISHMKENDFGRILNISSIVGQIGIPGTSNYAASKAGLVGMTRTVAKEVIKRNITVNTLSLGYFDTGMFKKIDESIQNKIISGIPMGRTGTIQELTSTVLFLCSENASYITGQNIHINGGLYM